MSPRGGYRGRGGVRGRGRRHDGISIVQRGRGGRGGGGRDNFIPFEEMWADILNRESR